MWLWQRDLGLWELHHVVADVVEQGERVNTQSCIFGPPDLIQELSQFQHSSRRIHSDQHVPIAAERLHDIGWKRVSNANTFEDKSSK